MPAAHPDLAVLIVDDEADIVTQLATGLKALGYRTLTAGSAAQALALLDGRGDIGVVLTDIRMPGGDGLGLARRIAAAQPDLAAVEVVLISGHGTIEDAAAAMRAEVVDFLHKPFRLREAGDAVGRALARAAARRGDALLRRELAEHGRAAEEARLRLEALLAGTQHQAFATGAAPPPAPAPAPAGEP
jgi:two-component system NtrC family response regulator/two-component system response regulator AtoC